MRKIGKKMQSVCKKLEDKFYPLEEAIQKAQEVSYANFNASLDLAFNLNLDVRQADQQLRGSIPLPYSTGKKVRILVLTDNNQKEIESLGVELVLGKTDFEELIKKGEINFDTIVTTPKMMPILGKYGKILGPKGLMPNPKVGTVTNDLIKTINEIQKGKANYRTDKNGNIHTMIGRISMSIEEIKENALTIIRMIKKLKPAKVKGKYIINLTISPTMGPSVKIALDNLL